MKATYVLDACVPCFAVLTNEPGADKVVDLYTKAALNEIILTAPLDGILKARYNNSRSTLTSAYI